ncbi:hypothetical protein ACHAXS_010765 [Conticribra weissflogii]
MDAHIGSHYIAHNSNSKRNDNHDGPSSTMSDLDESRRYGRPTSLQQQQQHHHEEPARQSPELGTSPDSNRSSLPSKSHNRWPSASSREGGFGNRQKQILRNRETQENGKHHGLSLPDQYRHGNITTITNEDGYSSENDVPLVLSPYQALDRDNPNNYPAVQNNNQDGNHHHLLDGELSGLQAAAAKTALVFGGKVVKKSHLDGVVTVEDYNDETDDGEDERGHWIFRRHVGFAIAPKISPAPSTYLHSDPQHLKSDSGTIRYNHGDHVRKLSANGIYQHTKIFTSPSQKEQQQQQQPKSLQPLEELENEKEKLLNQLSILRKQRQQIQQITIPTLQHHANEWNYQLSIIQHSYQIVMSNLQSLQNRSKSMEEEYAQSTKWHVLGDVFLIWHRGAFGTINGMRLGRSAVTSVGLVKRWDEVGCGSGNGRGNHDNGGAAGGTNNGNSGNPSNTNNHIGLVPPSSGMSSLITWGNTTEANNHDAGTAYDGINGNIDTNGNSSNNNPTTLSSAEKVIVPWTEINSALGQIVFLLYTLQHTPFNNITFRKHALQPLGSASKIGFLKKTASSSSTTNPQPHPGRRRITALASYYTPQQLQVQQQQQQIAERSDISWYNLHHYEENGSLLSIGYYARRNFNIALEGLLYCIAEAFLIVEKRDMALAAPYVISVDGLVVGVGAGKTNGGCKNGGGSSNSSGEATVGGLPVAYDPSEGERWTVVCKYLLTDLKWLIAYAAKHVER